MTKRILGVFVLVGSVSCGDVGPAVPSGPTPPANPGTTVTRLEVTGPANLTPTSGVVEYKATATYSDGSTRDVTSLATWRVLPQSLPQPVSVVRAGQVEARANGEAAIRATFAQVSASQNVLVLSPGTVKFGGRLVAGDGSALSSVIVQVVEGIGSGQRGMFLVSGNYVLYGVAGDIVVEVGAQGFGSQRFNVEASAEGGADLTLLPLVTTINLSGQWRATLQASPSCTWFPEGNRERSYEAGIEQQNGFASIVFSGPGLRDTRRSDRLGSYEVPRAFFANTDRFVFYLDAVTNFNEEVVGAYFLDTSELGTVEVSGTFSGTAGDRQFEMTLDGWVGSNQSFCYAMDHRMTFRRVNR